MELDGIMPITWRRVASQRARWETYGKHATPGVVLSHLTTDFGLRPCAARARWAQQKRVPQSLVSPAAPDSESHFCHAHTGSQDPSSGPGIPSVVTSKAELCHCGKHERLVPAAGTSCERL